MDSDNVILELLNITLLFFFLIFVYSFFFWFLDKLIIGLSGPFVPSLGSTVTSSGSSSGPWISSSGVSLDLSMSSDFPVFPLSGLAGL